MNLSNIFDMARNIYALPAYNSKVGKALIPLRYFFELSYRCNLNCPYCYVGDERQKDELSTDEWLNVIEQIPWYSFVTLVGGEPLIRKDFTKIAEAVGKKTFGKFNTVTNGILIDEDVIKAFVRSKMMLLSVSLDGYGENHDRNRNKEGIFEKVVNNLDTLNSLTSKRNRPMVDIKTIVLENNLDDLPKLYKLCSDMNFNFLSVSFLRNNNWKQNSHLVNEFIPEFNGNYPIEPYFDIEHFKEIYREIESLSKKSKVQIRYSPKFENSKNPLAKIEEFFKTAPDKPTSEIYKPCLYPCSNMMINPQGDVYPCLSMKIGNVRESNIKTIFNLPKYRCFRKNLKASGGTFGACQMCCELDLK